MTKNISEQPTVLTEDAFRSAAESLVLPEVAGVRAFDRASEMLEEVTPLGLFDILNDPARSDSFGAGQKDVMHQLVRKALESQ